MDPALLIEPAIDAVETGLTAVAGPALLVGGSIVALSVGWGFAKRFLGG